MPIITDVTRMQSGKRLIVDLGDVPSLVTLAMEERHDRVVVWHPVFSCEAQGQLLAAMRRRARALRVNQIVEQDCTFTLPGLRPTDSTDNDRSLPRRLSDIVILAACCAARNEGCGTVVLPIQVGPEFDGLSGWMERKVVLGQLANLRNDAVDGVNLRQTVVEIEPPVVDLNDQQIVDLAQRLNTSLEDAWWCEHDGPDACGGCPSCLRWEKAIGSCTPVTA